MPITGRTQFADLFSLIQVAEINRKNCLIIVTERGQEGRISLWNGEIVAVEVGDLWGQVAFCELCKWHSSNFQLLPLQRRPGPEMELGNFTLLMRGRPFLGDRDHYPELPAWHIAGDLDVLSLVEILQLFELNGNDGRGRIISTGGERGEIMFHDHRVVHATSDSEKGEEAVYKMLAWGARRLEIDHFRGAAEESVTESIPVLITRGMQRIEAEKRRAEREAKRAADLAATTLQDLEEGRLSRAQRVAVAKRYLPLGGTAPVESLLKLLDDPDLAVRQQTLETIRKLPVPVVRGVLFDRGASDVLLFHFGALFASDEELCESMLNNPNISDRTIARIAARASQPVLELIRKAAGDRIQRSRHLMEAVSRNEQVGPKETEPERAERKDAEERKHKGTVQTRLKELTFADKMFVARRGTPTQRMVLVRHPDKRIALAVLTNPQLTAGEVQTIACMKSVNPDVLSEISGRSEWSNQYSVAKALVLNPKTPPVAAIPHVVKLRERDLGPILRDRNAHEALRAAVRKRVRVLEQKRKI